MSKGKYVVKKADDSNLETMLNNWTNEDLEFVTLYPRGSGVVWVVFKSKK